MVHQKEYRMPQVIQNHLIFVVVQTIIKIEHVHILKMFENNKNYLTVFESEVIVICDHDH